jgi:EAL domain-containing protein (putative c-di-GMP-specific phosphodiesterase class I)
MPASILPSPAARVLIVDDSAALGESLAEILRLRGFEATVCSSGSEALTVLDGVRFDVILSDVSMPGMDGLELLGEIRKRDLDVPVVLVTGQPSVETAVRAVAHGAHRYLTKPISPPALIETARRAAQVCRIARERRAAGEELGELGGLPADVAGRHAVLDTALASLWLTFQPIVTNQGALFGYEALVRTDSRLFGAPGELIETARDLNRLEELFHNVLGQLALALAKAPPESVLLINVHPQSLRSLQSVAPDALRAQANRIVLEITERSSLTDVPNFTELIAGLRSAGFRIAIDDLGSGYAGLSSFVTLEPDLVKLDVALVRNIQDSRTRQKLVRSICALGKDMGFLVVAEGIEIEQEEATLLEAGCDLLQGFRYAHPAREFPAPSWAPSGASFAPPHSRARR